MKILIMGAGAIGSVVGGFLAKNGAEVTLVGRESHIKSIMTNGLRIHGIWGDHLIPPEQFRGLLTEPVVENFDYVLITVKAYDTESVAEQLKKIFFRTTENMPLFISMQNGIGNIETLQKILGRSNVAGARVIFGAKLNSPGAVTVTVIAEPTAFGNVGVVRNRKMDGALKDLAKRMDSAGIPSVYVDDIRPYLWAKVLYNSALNPLSALLERTYGELAEDTFTKKIMDNVIDEAFAVAKKLKVKLFWKAPKEYKKHFYNKLIPPTATHYASMLEDLKRKRTEIDAMNGAIAKYGRRHSVPTPVNETLTNLIKSLCG